MTLLKTSLANKYLAILTSSLDITRFLSWELVKI